MAVIGPITLAQEADDTTANVLANTITNAGVTQAGYSSSTSGDFQVAWVFNLGTTIPRYNIVSAAPFRVWLQSQPASNAITLEFAAIKAGSPTIPTTVAGISGATRTTAKVERSGNSGAGAAPLQITLDLSSVLNEILQTTAVTSVVVLVRDKVRSFANNNLVTFRNYGYDGTSASRPTLQITHDVPPAVTAQGTMRFGALSILGAGEIGFGVNDLGSLRVIGAAGEGDPKINVRFDVERPNKDTHFFLTTGGELIGFTAEYDTVIGGIRDAMMGLADDAWTPESGVTTRIPASLPFTLRLVDRDTPKLDGDVLERKLKLARAIIHPDGKRLPLEDVLLRARPADNILEVTARPTGSVLSGPLAGASMGSVFLTRGSTPEVPTYMVDPAGGLSVPVGFDRIDQGSMGFSVKFSERGFLPLASIGTPVGIAGETDPTSVVVWFADRNLHLSLRGVLNRVREAAIGPFGGVWALLLAFTAHRAWLVTRSSIGTLVHPLQIGAPVDLTEKILTAAVDAEGIGLGDFFSPGSASLNIPFLSPAVPVEMKAREAVDTYYAVIADPARSWEIVPPDYTLTITRADNKPVETAPGEAGVQLDFAITRGNGYSGGITVQPNTSAEIIPNWTEVSDDGIVKVIRLTLTAPAGTAESSFPFNLHVEATGASNPGSILADVKDDFDGSLDVAASPVIAPNSTYLLTMDDADQKRPAIILNDTSGNSNAFNFYGYARPTRRGRGALAVGKEGAAVASNALTNAAQAHRMSGTQTHAMVLRELLKSSTANGVLFQVVAENGTDGARIIRVQGGVALQTVIGSTVATSSASLPWSSGDLFLGLRFTSTEVILTSRQDMASISMPRPAWADAAVRVCWGAILGSGGVFSSLCRTHIAAAAGHPYNLTDIQLRRTLDKMIDYVSVSDGKPEYPDALYILSQFNPNTTEQPSERLRNYAAPGINPPTWTTRGAPTFPSGSVQTDGDDDLLTTGFVAFPSANDYQVVAVLNNLQQAGTYDYHFAAAGLSQYNGYWGVGRDGSNRLAVRAMANDATFFYGPLAGANMTGKVVVLVTVTGSSRYIRITDLKTGNTVQVDRGAVVTGNTSFSIGGALAAGNNGASDARLKFPASATGLEFLVHKGVMSAQEISDIKTLLL